MFNVHDLKVLHNFYELNFKSQERLLDVVQTTEAEQNESSSAFSTAGLLLIVSTIHLMSQFICPIQLSLLHQVLCEL